MQHFVREHSTRAVGAPSVCRITAAILAGGRSTRMGGRNKAFVAVNRAPMIVESVSLLRRLFGEVMIVTNTPHEYESLAHEAVILTDTIAGCGPLGGIHAALSHTAHDAVFVAGCDMPHLHDGLIEHMAERFTSMPQDALVPRLRGMAEPLHAIYRTSLADRITSFARHGATYSVNRFLQSVPVCYMDVDDSPEFHDAFVNVNTPEDVEHARKRQDNRVVGRWLEHIGRF